MSFLIGFLYVVEVVVCLLLALVVMLQKPKEGGLGGIAGGMSEAVFGADAGNVLVKATAWLGGIFLVTTLLLARLTASSSSAIDLSEPLENALAEEANKTVELDPSKVDAAAAPELPAQAQTPASTPEAPAQAKPQAATPEAPAQTKAPEAPAQAQTPAPTPAAK